MCISKKFPVPLKEFAYRKQTFPLLNRIHTRRENKEAHSRGTRRIFVPLRKDNEIKEPGDIPGLRCRRSFYWICSNKYQQKRFVGIILKGRVGECCWWYRYRCDWQQLITGYVATESLINSVEQVKNNMRKMCIQHNEIVSRRFIIDWSMVMIQILALSN